MNKRSRTILYLCFVFFLALSGTTFSQEFYKDKTAPSLEKVQQICKLGGQYYMGQYKDSSGVLHLFYFKPDLSTSELILYHLDTDFWIASGACSCDWCSRAITK